MKWSNTTPAKGGYYWMHTDEDPVSLVHVDMDDKSVNFFNGDYVWLDGEYAEAARWQGPIKPEDE